MKHLLIGALALAGCYSGERATPLGSERHPALVPGAAVQVLFNKPFGDGFHEFAVYQRGINVGDASGLREFLDFVREEARRLGSRVVQVQEDNTQPRKTILTAHFLATSGG